MDRADSFLSSILRSLNDAIPRRVVKYREIVNSGVYSVETVGGSQHFFNPHEIAEIARILPAHILDGLHLPFVFVKSFDSEESVYYIRVYGTEAEAFKKLAGVEVLPRNDRGFYTYKPLVSEFISKYPSLAVMGYL
ncbi:MAG: DUF61 family protein [Candidatus Caldarchaeum sp.]|nr:DUF61 family protein [Candidatus Caldarchaeum sp.]MDW8359845.1 DUF61 family protein [Candidatus Caldarchaeum sp.]